MDTIKIGKHIVSLRRNKKITQEELADFIGVTKASVSKWETGQSLPDITLLPQLAAFFDVSIDELIGYEPQLTKGQIQSMYHELARDFAQKDFDEVMEKSRSLVKQYYACYSFLFQICNLWLNHYMLAAGFEKQKEILQEASNLCDHILTECKEIGLNNDAVILRAYIDLQLGKAKEVIDCLEELLNPVRLSMQCDIVLSTAYVMAGQMDQAESFTQISMYTHLLNLVSAATEYLELHAEDLAVCEKTIDRMDQVAKAFQLSKLHPNSAALLYYQEAVVYALHQRKDEALACIRQYVTIIEWMLAGDHLMLHGDDYFDRVSEWFDKTGLGNEAPRDKKIIWESAQQIFRHPAFSIFEKDADYQRLQRILREKE